MALLVAIHMVREVRILADLPVMPLVPAEDLERARRFYELTLGLRLLRATQTEAWYECQNGRTLRLYLKPAPAASVSLSWEVPDINKVIRQLSQKGIVFEGREEAARKAERPPCGPPVVRAIRFKDTEGNLVDLAQFHG